MFDVRDGREASQEGEMAVAVVCVNGRGNETSTLHCKTCQ